MSDHNEQSGLTAYQMLLLMYEMETLSAIDNRVTDMSDCRDAKNIFNYIKAINTNKK